MRKIFGVIMATTMAFYCAACGGAGGESGGPAVTPPAADGKYIVYDASDSVKYEADNPFSAIIQAGKMSTRSNRHYVKHGEQVIFKHTSDKYYKFLGSEYAGVIEVDAKNTAKADAEADAWAGKNPTGYVVNGTGNKYIALGRKVMPDSQAVTGATFGMELFSGSYMYAYTKRNDADPAFDGVGYIECTLDFTGVTFKYPKSDTEKDWNAYIFTNFFTTSPWGCCYIGFINGTGSVPGSWTPIFNLAGRGMVAPSLEPVTVMRYDEAADTYYGTDRLRFRTYVTRKAYCMEIENLTTGKQFTYTVDCVDNALEKKADKAFGLLAASYCPVLSQTEMWNARSGAVFTGLKFRNPTTAQFIEGATCADDYAAAEKTAFLPSEPSVFGYGFAQGADNSSYTIGTDEEGTYIETDISYTEEF